MDIHQKLNDLLMKATSECEKAKEIEELSQKHREINRQLKDKTYTALQKDKQGQIVSDAEQAEIDDLAKQQEVLYKKMADKMLNK